MDDETVCGVCRSSLDGALGFVESPSDKAPSRRGPRMFGLLVLRIVEIAAGIGATFVGALIIAAGWNIPGALLCGRGSLQTQVCHHVVIVVGIGCIVMSFGTLELVILGRLMSGSAGLHDAPSDQQKAFHLSIGSLCMADLAPEDIAPYPPVLHEGSATLNPASIAGCTSLYPIGGYDC